MSTNALQKNPIQNFGQFFMAKSKNLAGLIPKHLTPDRVAKIAISALMRQPKLLQCKMETVWFQVAQAASLGLEINLLGAAYLVPFKNNKTGGMDCQLIVGYQGLIDLARRSGNIQSIEARIVYEKDKFEVKYGLNPVLSHEPCLDGDAGKMRLVYGIAILRDGGTQVEIMTKNEINEIRARSKAKDSGPWLTDYNEMARKTVIRRLAKYLPKSIEMSQAMALDDAGDAGELQLAGLDVENMDDVAEAIVVDEPQTSDTTKAKMSEKLTKPKPAESNLEFTKSLAKLSLMYDERGKEIDEMLHMNGIDGDLIDIKPDCNDEKTIMAVIRIAKEF